MNSIKRIPYFLLILFAVLSVSCSRADENEDVLSQEDISNIILKVKDDATGITATYNYTVNSVTVPEIKLTDGKTYTVETVFKNGNEDVTQEIISALDEHFFVFAFQGAQINLTRMDDIIRADGNRVGFKTKWTVIKTVDSAAPVLEFKIIHDAASVNENQNGFAFGTVVGGETDAMAVFRLNN
ncbi:hypothetical protein [Chryseobacterium sp.]|uniref:hypothetical protein n=1 Tax=Chryseobacterium sp. TaxID=1871047 RepID=UPI0011CA605F|nr:hypothetical protein [Chryseobacterium sp.]TXF75160.1 hypothetical protein FUA25_12915 [Chryseobacterium sp.]